MTLLVLLNIFCTFTLTGLVWLIQVVHYPLFLKVGVNNFKSYHLSHGSLITYIVGPLMVLEMISSLLLCIEEPFHIELFPFYFGFFLVCIIWFSTLFIQVPLHNKLLLHYDREVIQQLVKTNWIRTFSWTIRSFILLFLLNKLVDV